MYWVYLAQLRMNEHLPLGVQTLLPRVGAAQKARTLFSCVLHIHFTVPPLSRRPKCPLPSPLPEQRWREGGEGEKSTNFSLDLPLL